VTAETAVVLPVLVSLVLGLTWLFGVAVAQVRVVDAAREAARAAARGETASAAVSQGQQVAPDGATVRVTTGAETVEVAVVAPVNGPGGLFSVLPAIEVSADATAAREPS
jgi:Flp pilus assembly protein TadG